MKIYVTHSKVKGKVYENYKASLTKREALQLLKLGKSFKIEDVDPKGSVWLKVVDQTTTTFKDLGDPVSSFRVYLSGDEYERVKRIVRGRGLSLCRVVSDFLRCVLEEPGLVESPGGVKIVNVFLGKPRSKWERKLWSERLKGEEYG